MTPERLVLLLGFDRCGSSMTARMLGAHPGVNLVFHPFNSTEVHRDQWRIWPAGEVHDDTAQFWQSLRRGVLDGSYLRAHWHDAHGSWSHDAHTVVVKDTKAHFHVAWLRRVVPDLRIVGLWRDPTEILGSLVHNGFHETWYGGDMLSRLLATWPDGLDAMRTIAERAETSVERMAVMIAARTAGLFRSLPPSDVLRYRRILADPERLNELVGNHRALSFQPLLAEDYNVSGTARPRGARYAPPPLAVDAFRELDRSLQHLFVGSGEGRRWRPTLGDHVEPDAE